jgi:PIF1-like helicase
VQLFTQAVADLGSRLLIVDEISMMNAEVMAKLSSSLGALRGVDDDFGGVDVVFTGDFLQLPSIGGDLWKSDDEETLTTGTGGQRKKHKKLSKKDAECYERLARGQQLWRSLNALVILEEQMRQLDDEPFVELLQALQYGKIEPEHLQTLRSQIMTSAKDLEGCEVILVRRNQIHNAINDFMVHNEAQHLRIDVIYCVAEIKKNPGKLSQQFIYSLRSNSDIPGDSVLALIPGAPVMITKNIDVEAGIFI